MPITIPNAIEVDEIRDPTGGKYALNNGRNRAVLSEAGGGLPPINYLVSQGPLQDGQTLRGFRLQPRTYTLLVRWQGCTRDQYWAYRSKLLDVIRPNRQVYGSLSALTFRKYFRDGTQRDLYVMPAQGPEFTGRNPNEWDENGWTETVRFTAFDPTWYNPTTQTRSSAGTTSDNLVFPFTAPFIFGAYWVASLSCVYVGTWAVQPTISIDGPFNGAVIQNLATGESISFNYAMPLGNSVVFNFANHTALRNDGVNLVPYVSGTSDFGTFHFEPSPTAPGGVNTVVVTAGQVAGYTPTVTVQWLTRYIGI